MHVVIYFCGTGDEGGIFNDRAYLRHNKIETVFVQGCQTPEVCDAALFPNLKAFAKRFTNKLFNKDSAGNLVINQDDESRVSVGISPYYSRKVESTPIESITLCGYSRGAVTCFEVAKQLNIIAPGVPVKIVANQPVPGNCYQGPGTNAASIADCRDLKNLKNASVILGAYTGTQYHGEEETTDSIHRGFFSQIVPELPRTAKRDLIVIPIESHYQLLPNSTYCGAEHMHMQIARYLNEQDKTLVSDVIVQEKIKQAENSYISKKSRGPKLFPQQAKLQTIFGLRPAEVYRYLDKLHPTAGLREGYTLGTTETLISWWKKHDKKCSLFSSKLTKDLVKSIKSTDINKVDSLKTLFAQADKWLLLKADRFTSRYYQVASLRNNIFHRLTDEWGIYKSGLAEINRHNLKETHYFVNHWKLVSKEASYFKTDATRGLDKAFMAHDIAPASKANDEELMAALDTWLDAKKESNSKRWVAVIKIKEHLTEVINNYPADTLTETLKESPSL